MQAELSIAGQHLILGLSGTSLNDLDKQLLEEIQPRGVLLLKRNFAHEIPYQDWLERWAALLADIRSRLSHQDVIVSIDHEGGRVHRVPSPLTKFPSPACFADQAKEVGLAMARELVSIGVNVSWAPSADVNSNPKNPVIGERSFGNTAAYVANSACAFAAGLALGGIIGCAKHFPGHGDTDVDSHFALPSVRRSLEQIEALELLPFRALIEEGIGCVMTAHILFPQIDSENPATLSNKILDGILRQKLNFQGVIVSDDLDMLAVRPLTERAGAFVGALDAGLDLFILARHPNCDDTRPLVVAQRLAQAIANNPDYHPNSDGRIRSYISDRLLAPTVSALDPQTLSAHSELAKKLRSAQSLEEAK